MDDSGCFRRGAKAVSKMRIGDLLRNGEDKGGGRNDERMTNGR